jgi:hypothetical protein
MDYRQFYLKEDPRYQEWVKKWNTLNGIDQDRVQEQIRFVSTIALDCGFYAFKKADESRIHCFQCTQEQLMEFARRCRQLKLAEEK